MPDSSASAESAPPADWPRAKVLAVWKTRISGKPARAYAVRADDAVLLQVRVDDRVFYNNPRVRQAVEDQGHFETRDHSLKVVALPLSEGGVLIVGPADRMPPVRLSVKKF